MSPNHIPGGGFTVARQLFRSDIWRRDPLNLKIWIWILGRASHSDHEKNGQNYIRGEFVTTYDEIIKAGMYIYNRRKYFPTVKKIRVILNWFEKEGMISVNPLKSELDRTGTDTAATTRAYIGLHITVSNYDIYQNKKITRSCTRAETCLNKGTIIIMVIIRVKKEPLIFLKKFLPSNPGIKPPN